MNTWQPSAKIIADSISPQGKRLTSVQVETHRFVLAEINTHRAFSRNSASSRAIPYQKMRAKALEQTAYPVSWPAEQKGMQGGTELSKEVQQAAREVWELGVMTAVNKADQLHLLGVHKSVINRLLEPFIPHTVLISATEWQGFFDQRCHPDAQPEIRAAAETIRQAMEESTPVELDYSDWHMPYINAEDIVEAERRFDPDFADWFAIDGPAGVLRAISVARSARVSYLTQENKRDIMEDVMLYFRLRDHVPAHASPFEHVATPANPRIVSNFKGWNQLRGILGL